MDKCRYVPNLVSIDGEKDSIIKKVLEVNKKEWLWFMKTKFYEINILSESYWI